MVLYQVLTTEKVPFNYRVAGLGSRLLAWLADAGIVVLLAAMAAMIGNVLEIGRAGFGMAVMLLGLFILQWFYFWVFEWAWHGQTPGKRLAGIRVIQTSGSSITFLQSGVRNTIRWVDALPFFYVVGFLAAICNREQRRLGDLAAGTLVVHVERPVQPILTRHDLTTEFGQINAAQVRQRLGQLRRPQKQLLLDLCLRRDQLRVDERARLFHAAAEFLSNRIEVAPAPLQSDEKFVLQLAAVLTEPEALPAPVPATPLGSKG